MTMKVLIFLLGTVLYSATSVYAINEAKQYIGCYRDNGNRTMGDIVITGDNMQNDLCVSKCKEMKRTFSGTEIGRECFCSDDYRRYGTSDMCTYKCAGNNTQKCGSDWALSVYTVCEFGRFGIGCNQNCSSNCSPTHRRVCRYESGECVYGCKPGMAGTHCDCFSLDGDHRNDVGCMKGNLNTSLKIFTTLTFPRLTKVTGVRYYAANKGKVFVSFWRKKNSDDQFNWTMVDKIELDPSSVGVQEFKMNEDYIEVNTGDAVGVHYPNGSKDGVIPCQTYETDDISNFYITIQSNQLDNGWNSNQTFHVYPQTRPQLVPALKIMYNCIQDCPSESDGERCSLSCPKNCDSGACNNYSGECHQGCVKGKYGRFCNRICTRGFYGNNCSQQCSRHCLNNATCDKITGYCPHGCTAGYKWKKCGTMVSRGGGGGKVGAIVGVLVVVVIVLAIIGFILYKKRYKPTKKYNEVHVQYSNKPMAPNDEPVTDNAIAFPTNGTVEIPSKPVVSVKPYSCSEGLYVNVTLDNKKTPSSSSTRIPVSELGAYIANQMKGKEPFKLEYNDIPLDKNDSWDYCSKPELRFKNRFKNIMPYDKNRVSLNVINDNPFSDYINASFIDDYRGRQTFIACHGPNKVTIPDFWRMIWEYNISVIVMVTNLVEKCKVKCDRYWPVEVDIQHAGIRISKVNVEPYSEYEIRTFNLTKDGEQRPLRQYHYTGWPDHGVPPSVAGIRCIREKVKPQKKMGPVLVHCSAGAGRTGTFISLDILLDQVDNEDAVDINACVKKLRSQRVNMVQTLDQYIFIYKALREATVVGKTGIVCSDFASSLQQLLHKRPTDKTAMEKQFEFLESIKPEFAKEEMDTALSEQNRKNNRDKNVVPSDRHVIIMSSSPNSYINAVFVPGYRSKKGFIATQVPFDGDESIWRLITDLKCGTAVLLENSKENHKWYPVKQQRLEVKSFMIENRGETVKRNIKQQDLRMCLKNKEECTDYANIEQLSVSLRLFSPIIWTTNIYSGRNIEELVELYTEVLNWIQKSENKTVLVMCSNGAQESGIYIASSYLFDMAKVEHTVDIFNVVKYIRTTRPQFIDSMTEYNFLHTIVASFLGGFAEYANFK